MKIYKETFFQGDLKAKNYFQNIHYQGNISGIFLSHSTYIAANVSVSILRTTAIMEIRSPSLCIYVRYLNLVS